MIGWKIGIKTVKTAILHGRFFMAFSLLLEAVRASPIYFEFMPGYIIALEACFDISHWTGLDFLRFATVKTNEVMVMLLV